MKIMYAICFTGLQLKLTDIDCVSKKLCKCAVCQRWGGGGEGGGFQLGGFAWVYFPGQNLEKWPQKITKTILKLRGIYHQNWRKFSF